MHKIGEIQKIIKGRYPHKYTAILNDGSKVNFGDQRYEQYKDRTTLNLYGHMNHLDEKRRKAYRNRAEKIKNKKGEYTYKIPHTANWFSYNFLW